MRQALMDNRGNVAMIFALSATALFTMTAAAVEWTRVAQAQAKLSAAADAAVLAAKRQQMDKRSEGAAAAFTAGVASGQAAFTRNTVELATVADDLAVAITWDSDESARAVATGKARLMLGGLLGWAVVPIRATAVASSGGDTFYEVAMVLDNTASMFLTDGRPSSRFTLLREASASFVNAAFDNMGAPNLLRMSVIPWATSVNIKSEEPLTWNPAAGPALTTVDRGSQSLPAVTLNRNGEIVENNTTLNTMFAPVGWRGCISGAGESLTADDSPKAGMKWNALAVPPNLHMANWRPTITENATCEDCSMLPPPPPGPPSPPPPPPPPPDPGMDAKWDGGRKQNKPVFASLSGPRTPEQARFLSFLGPTANVQTPGCTQYACTRTVCDMTYTPTPEPKCAAVGQDTKKYYGVGPYAAGRRNSFFASNTTCVNHGDPWVCATPKPESTQQACVSDPNEIAWNSGGGRVCEHVALPAWDTLVPTVGPNLNCPMPMLGLSGSRAQVLQTLNRMSPVVGGTHADVGLRWGLRSLSPRNQWANFFGNNGVKKPTNFSSANSKKAMILITDGENAVANDFPGYWGCSETGSPGCSGAPDQAELDARMLAWCEAIRDDHSVELYTVAVNITNTTAVANLATCAGDPARAFSVDASQLNKTLEDVAKQIFRLRLRE